MRNAQDLPESLEAVLEAARACRACAEALPHAPRPVLRARDSARLMIVGQAPGRRVHESGIPWNDPSGDRLRDWLALSPDTFYDESRIAIVPMGFCYPGTVKGADLPPRPECAPLWHERLRAVLPNISLTLLVGSYAQKRYLPGKRSMTETVAAWRDALPSFLPTPHPSWRTVAWQKRNPWFEAELVPRVAHTSPRSAWPLGCLASPAINHDWVTISLTWDLIPWGGDMWTDTAAGSRGAALFKEAASEPPLWAVFSDLAGSPVLRLEPAHETATRSWKVWLEDGRVLAGKSYGSAATAPRDPIGRAFLGLSFLRDHGGGDIVPEPIAADMERGAALYSWLPGDWADPHAPEMRGRNDLRQCLSSSTTCIIWRAARTRARSPQPMAPAIASWPCSRNCSGVRPG